MKFYFIVRRRERDGGHFLPDRKIFSISSVLNVSRHVFEESSRRYISRPHFPNKNAPFHLSPMTYAGLLFTRVSIIGSTISTMRMTCALMYPILQRTPNVSDITFAKKQISSIINIHLFTTADPLKAIRRTSLSPRKHTYVFENP